MNTLQVIMHKYIHSQTHGGVDALAELKSVKFDPHRFLEPQSKGDATGSVSHLQPLTLIQCNLKWIQLDSLTFNSLTVSLSSITGT